MVFTSTSAHMVEQVPPNGRRQCLCPQGELQLLPTSLGDSLRSTGRSDPGSVQIAACILGSQGVWDFVGAFYEQSLYFFQSSGSSTSKHNWSSKTNIMGVHPPGMGLLGWRAQYGAQTNHFLGRTSATIIILPFVNLDRTTTQPPIALALKLILMYAYNREVRCWPHVLLSARKWVSWGICPDLSALVLYVT